MNPSAMFCPDASCSMHGQVGQGNIVCHSRQERRYRCKTCGHTFAETKGTPFFRLHHPEELFTLVLALLSHGCPLQAIVFAFSLDERTVAAWALRGGVHCQAIHAALVEAGRVAAGQVQADELWGKLQRGKAWLALALAVPSRLWLGGAISARRDGDLIRELAQGVRRCLADLGILLCVDGFASYLTEFPRIFRVPAPREPGKRGKTPRVLPQGFLLAQVVKSYVKKRVAGVAQRVICGTEATILARIAATGGRMIQTAYIERLNATFRSRLAGLVRRSRNLLRQEAGLRAGLFLVGTVYNFCTPHQSLREESAAGGRAKWVRRTPAMAAGLTDHVWTMDELLHYRVRPRPVDLGRWRGRRRKGAVTPRRRSSGVRETFTV